MKEAISLSSAPDVHLLAVLIYRNLKCFIQLLPPLRVSQHNCPTTHVLEKYINRVRDKEDEKQPPKPVTLTLTTKIRSRTAQPYNTCTCSSSQAVIASPFL